MPGPAFPKLFEPIAIGPRHARNRVMRLPTTAMLADQNQVGDRMLAFYAAVARGGVGTIVTESFTVRPRRGTAPGSIMMSNGVGPIVVTDRECVSGLRRLAETVHEAGALLIGQLYHSGRQHLGRIIPTLMAPSAIACPQSGGTPHELTAGEVAQMIEAFVIAAEHCIEAGMDGVEIHGAQGHLVQQFASPFSNRRTDAYGGSRNNRMRFAREIMAAIRERLGRDVIIGYRMAVAELHDGGIAVEETEENVRDLAREMVLDYLSLSQGNFNSNEVHIPDRYFPQTSYRSLHSRIKAVAGPLLVAMCGRVESPADAEDIVASGDADIVALCRTLIADPEWPAKALSGRPDAIRGCIVCNKCWDNISDGRPIRCTVNAAAGREHVLGPIRRADASRKVTVIGGGPAGLEAARVAALRGHHVTLIEREAELGGKMRQAHKAPHHAELRRVPEFLISQVLEMGVAVRTGVVATADIVLAERPDAIVVATGSRICVPAVPGDGSVPILPFDGTLDLGDLEGDVIVVMDEDGYAWGAAAAEAAAQTGKKVLLVTRFFEVLRELPSVSRITTLGALDRKGVDLRPNMFAAATKDHGVLLEHFRSGRRQHVTNVAAVIWTGVQQANDELAKSLSACGVDHLHLIGDAYAPRRLLFALEEGHAAGRAI